MFGGGTAGWMTAAYFYEQGGYDVMLIESPKFKPFELSAATTPYIKRFLKDIGITNESEWMPACKATYKLGALYDDWNGKGTRWWNGMEADEFYHLYWNKQRSEEGLPVSDFFKSRIYSSHIAMEDSAKWITDKEGKSAYPYQPVKSYGGHPEPWAYHIDTGAFNAFLKDRYKDKINLVITTIDEVNQDDSGITALIDDKGSKYSADLYVDCSGFSSKLIEAVNPEGRVPMSPYLTHDKAVVIEVPYVDVDKEMKPRTLSKALSAGWMWNIGLYDRMVNGYVYTSEYISDEEAKQELLDTTNRMFGDDRLNGVDTRVLNIRTGHHPRPWCKNVIALGVSAGFIEPMEATLLMLVQFSLINIQEVFKETITIDDFNDKYEHTLMDTLDWVSTNYYMSSRQDSEFWRFKSRNENQIRPRMQEWLKSCEKTIVPPKEDILFFPSCWYAKLVGFEMFPEGDGFDDTEGDVLPTYSNSNFKPQNKFKYKEMDELNARTVMNQRRSFDTSVLISQKEYLDRFIYKLC